jgi:bacillithiol biosynthesis cysteine-adding enzyme BshC
MTTWLDFRDLSITGNAFSKLFLDYVNDFQRVHQFYGSNFRNEADWTTLFRQLESRHLKRTNLVQILTNQNKNFHCGVRTLANIDSLVNDSTFAVVTGQQVGLFTGPMYTIYKTLTTIKLAEQLAKKFPDFQFVPVFWLEGEDHDFEEVSKIHLINPANDIATLQYQIEGKTPEKNMGAVGLLQFDKALPGFFDSVDQALLQTEFKPKVLELFRTAYQEGMTFNKAFVHLMNVLLEDSGLVFLDPHDTQIKQLLLPVFEHELATTPRTCQLVIDQSAELEKQYHAQVKPRPINLFVFHEGSRYPLEPHPEGFALKGTRKHFTKDELFSLLRSSPQSFSPNVVLRPICQDTLLPTAAYVAGPSEVAYFAQFRPVYQEFGIPEPIIYPRSSITIMEEKVEKVFERFSLQLVDFTRDIEFVKEKVAAQLAGVNINETFAAAQHGAEESMSTLEKALQSVDQTLLGALESTKGRIKSNLEGLKEKALAAQKRQHEVFLRQIDKAAIHIFPDSDFQERKLNVLYFLNKYGLEFVRWLHNEVHIDKFKHQVIHL